MTPKSFLRQSFICSSRRVPVEAAKLDVGARYPMNCSRVETIVSDVMGYCSFLEKASAICDIRRRLSNVLANPRL